MNQNDGKQYVFTEPQGWVYACFESQTPQISGCMTYLFYSLTYLCQKNTLYLMRTTIRIDDHILREAKKAAIESNISLTALVEQALKEVLYRRKTEKKSPLELVTFKGNGVRHGVDLDDSSVLLDLMDGF